MPAVSVIMPAYNVAPYLGQAIESVLAQTFRDFELLVIDDGSRDRTRAIAEEYAARDPRVRVRTKKNGGISSARNDALRVSRGDVIALLDGDDLWDPEYLDAQLEMLNADGGADIVTANARNLGGRHNGLAARPFPDSRPQPNLARILADEESVFIMSLFRRRVYETVGDFDETLFTNEDYDYWLRAAVHGFTFRRNDRPLGSYRRRGDSLSASSITMLQGILRVYAKVRPLLTERPVELAILDGQVLRFETERLRAEAREAIEAGNMPAAAKYLDLLRRRRRNPAATVAHYMARWTPRLLARAYQFRQALREAS